MSALCEQKNKINFLHFFICGVLLLPTIMKVFECLSFLPTQYVTYLIYGALWVCLLINVLKNFHAYTYVTLVMLLIATLFCVTELLVFPDNSKYIWSFDLKSSFTFIPYNLFFAIMFIVPGLLVGDYDGFIDTLHSFSRVGIIIGAFAYALFVYLGQDMKYDDMNFSYSLCIFVCTLIAKTQKNDIWFVLVGFGCMFIAGTRGPLLCSIVAIILNILLNRKNKRTIIYIIICVVSIILIWFGMLDKLIDVVDDGLSAMGFDDLRLLDYYREGSMVDTSGRSDLSEKLIQEILRRPLLGLGVGADRMLLDGSYVHNIVVEVIGSFGVAFGGLMLLALFVVIVRSLFSKNKGLGLVSFVFFTSIVLKLFFSSSILGCREFSIFLGICIGGLINQRKKLSGASELKTDTSNMKSRG